eukprot:5555872-Prymnesium_polylepis.2
MLTRVRVAHCWVAHGSDAKRSRHAAEATGIAPGERATERALRWPQKLALELPGLGRHAQPACVEQAGAREVSGDALRLYTLFTARVGTPGPLGADTGQ